MKYLILLALSFNALACEEPAPPPVVVEVAPPVLEVASAPLAPVDVSGIPSGCQPTEVNNVHLCLSDGVKMRCLVLDGEILDCREYVPVAEWVFITPPPRIK